MLNTLVSLKSYIGTIVVFVLFIISFIVLVATFSVENIKFLLIPITISLGLALMNSVVYLQAIVNMKEDTVTNQDAQIMLKECPEYWIKDTMTRPNANGNMEYVDVCKNYMNDPKKQNVTRFVGGSASESNGQFATNFGDGDTDSNIDNVLSNLNDLSEGFVDYMDTNTMEPGTESNNNLLVNSDENQDNRKVLYVGSSNYASQSNEAISNIPGSHYHFISSMTQHNNNTPLDEHNSNNGAVWHWHADPSTASSVEQMDQVCESNWICKSSSSDGIIINLEQLNSQSNDTLCGNARQFHWVEAANKCDFASL